MGTVGGRLGAFALVLAGSFGTAYAVGEQLPGHSHGSTHSHSQGTMPTTAVLPSDQNAGFRLVDEGAAADASLRYHLVDAGGKVVTRYSLDHGAEIHVVITRPDLSDFRHVHPDIATDGTWTLPTPGPGPWHLVFETTPTDAAGPVVVATDLDDGSAYTAQPLPDPADTVTVHGLTVVRTGLSFAVHGPDGQPATGLEPYLGSPAHLVVLHEGDLAYLHLHPTGDMTDMAGMFMFTGSLPTAGSSRLFLQFGYRGDVVTVPFTVNGGGS